MEDVLNVFNKKENMLIEKAKLHVKSHTASNLEILLLKVIDEKIMDTSYDIFETCESNRQFSEGVGKFNNLAISAIDCINYLQVRNNNGCESMNIVCNFVEEIAINKTQEMAHSKSRAQKLMLVIEQMEPYKNYTILDLAEMLEDDGYETEGIYQIISRLVSAGMLERVKQGVFMKVL